MQHGPKFLVLKNLIAAGMKLVEVNIIRLQRPERILQLPPNLIRRPGIGFLRGTRIGMAEFGGHHPIRPPAFYAFPNERFHGVVAVTFGRVHEIDSQLVGAPQHLVHLGL